MVKNIALAVSLLLNYLLYTGQLDLGQYRNYVEKSAGVIKEKADSLSEAGSGKVDNADINQ